MDTIGCKHYQRTCEILAPCCNKFYICHLCHDEEYKGVKGPGCLVERMDRKQIKTIRCKNCSKEQESSSQCKFCDIIFSKYFCKECNLFENNPNKDIYHCFGCGICRIGKEGQYFHCDKCKACLPLIKKSKHQCNEDGMNQNCSICLENLFYSRDSSITLECCKNWIHLHCYEEYIKKFATCPYCSKSLFKMSKKEIEKIDKILADTKEALPIELKDKKVSILCNDCLAKTDNIDYHPMGIKCSKCGSYNTKM